METFLHEVAQRILRDNPDNLDQVLVVFNNRRPSLFLRRELAAQGESRKAFFLPHIVGIDELISDMSSLKIIPKEFLLFELYDIHRQICTDEHKDQPFEDFLSFGEMMLNDFSEIDLYKVDAAQLFNNLSDLKAIGEWDIEDPHLNSFQIRYLHFYKSLYQYYCLLRKRLASQGKAYSGMAYREVAEHIETLIEQLAYRRIYFVGFSVLSECERIIIKSCVGRGLGEIITDGDSYYVNDSNQEAGLFLRKLKELSPTALTYPSNFDHEEKHIHLVCCPENLMQTKYAGNLLGELLSAKRPSDQDPAENSAGCTSKEESRKIESKNDDNTHGTCNLENTCIVLADEDLLLPMLNSLPPQVAKTNVTMGLPFTYSAVHTLLLRLLQLYKSCHGKKFYQRDLLDLLSDHSIGLLLNSNDLYSKALKYLATNTLVYIDASQLRTMFAKIKVNADPIQFIFEPFTLETDSSNQDEAATSKSPYDSPALFLSSCKLLITRLSQLPSFCKNIEEHEALACGYEIIAYLDELQQTHHYIETLNTMEKIYTRLAQRHNIAFYGDPLEGLQILGVLETRCLDFDRIIILSVNENIIPSGKSGNTLIPFSLKCAAKMPTYREKDAVYAYHFYRMLQRAGDITLVYHNETDSTSKGEPSRFIKQLTAELVPSHPNIRLDRATVSVNGQSAQMKPNACAEKDASVMEQLLSQAQHGFSPSALNLYHLCPMQFYGRYVLHVNEQTDVEEDIEAAELGTIIHDILHDIYSLDTGGKINSLTLQNELRHVDQLVEKKFADSYQRGRSAEGRNYYYRSIAKTQISELLKKEIALLEQGSSIRMIASEEDLRVPLSIPLSDKTAEVYIFGRADRIDRLNGQLRIIDYKTGKVIASELTYNDATQSDFSGKWFQVMTYAWLYHQTHADEPVQSGIYPLNNLNDPFLEVQWNGTSIFEERQFEDFYQLLRGIVAEIMDCRLPFLATPSSKACSFCLFRPICSVAQ